MTDVTLERADDADLTGADCGGVTRTVSRLVGVMNLTEPFTIDADTIGFQFNFILTDYGVQFYDTDTDNLPNEFGSGPFSGRFTIASG